MARDTRQRILDCALAMFNDEGESNVTTNHIADALGISPGRRPLGATRAASMRCS